MTGDTCTKSDETANLDMLVAELDYENRLLRARNDRLTREVEELQAEVAALRATPQVRFLPSEDTEGGGL